MRIAAGIILIVIGVCSVVLPIKIADVLALNVVESSWGVLLLGLFLMVLIIGGGIWALVKKGWGWAFSGAICSVLVGLTYTIVDLFNLSPAAPFAFALGYASIGILIGLIGILAVIFLVKSKGEFVLN